MFDNTAPDTIAPARAAAWSDLSPATKTVGLAEQWVAESASTDSRAVAKGFSQVTNTPPDSNTVGLQTGWNDLPPEENTAATAGGVGDMTVAAPSPNTVGLATAWSPLGSDADTRATADAFTQFPDVAAESKSVGVATSFDNLPPGSIDLSSQGAFTDQSATAFVLQGEVAPVNGVTTPASPIAVPFNTTLVAGTNYLVEVGGRASIVTVTLPDPPSLTQRIEIADVSGHGSAFPITVNAGTKVISDTNSSTYSIDRSYAVLVLSYTGTAWKIL
jgi:hypothetical protein